MKQSWSWTLRPVRPADEPFLSELYRQGRAAELAATGWPDVQIRAFLNSQFHLRERHFHQVFAQAAFDLVLIQGEPVGRITVANEPQGLHLVDLALLPSCQGSGLGSQLMQTLLDRARAQACPVTLQVLAQNPARRLYRRLGFQETPGDGYYLPMRWEPNEA